MKLLNVLGLTLFGSGVVMIIGFVFYIIFKDSEIPTIVRWGLIGISAGVVLMIISLTKERINDKDL